MFLSLVDALSDDASESVGAILWSCICTIRQPIDPPD